MENNKTAKANGKSLPISAKQSMEICNWIRGKNLNKAIFMLNRVLEKKQAVPFTRFNNDMGHKPGIGPGRFPEKSTKHIIDLLEGVKSNAQMKGLNTDLLKITHLVANKASRPWRFGRHRRRKAKRAHVEVIVTEIEENIKIKKENPNKKETKQDKTPGEIKKAPKEVKKVEEKEDKKSSIEETKMAPPKEDKDLTKKKE